jgi:hypothetical protein
MKPTQWTPYSSRAFSYVTKSLTRDAMVGEISIRQAILKKNKFKIQIDAIACTK